MVTRKKTAKRTPSKANSSKTRKSTASGAASKTAAPVRPKKTSAKPLRVAAAKTEKSSPGALKTKASAALKGKPTTIDEYLACVDGETKTLLQALRQTIHELVPEVIECISYSMPAFRFRGKVIAGFLATKAGASYFPFSGTTLGTLASVLAGRSQTKSGLHFTADQPLSRELVNTLLQARIAEL